MLGRSLIIFASLLAASPVLGQAADPKAARDAANWDVFYKLYPPRALAAHEEGAVGFMVTLDSKGEVSGCQITHSSGHPLLDQETCQLVTLHAQFSPDRSLGPSQRRNHEGMIAWKLPASATVLAAPNPVEGSTAPEKMVCKRTVRIGTLAGFERTCMTPTEWAKQTDQQKEPWADLQGKKGSTSGVSCLNPSGC